MKQITYQDLKILRQVYKHSLDQLYESPSQQRIDTLTNLLGCLSLTFSIPGFGESLNSAGQIQMTASIQILKVKCGMYKGYQVKNLALSIDALLYLFSKNLKNYPKKIKQTKLEINEIQLYGRMFTNDKLFLFSTILFKLTLPKFESQIKNQSKIEHLWSTLICNIIYSLKKQSEDKIIFKCLTILYDICNGNVAFKKQIIKNGIIPFVISKINNSKSKWLIIEILKLLELVTQEKQIAKLLIDQNIEEAFIKISNQFHNEQINKKITSIMNNLIKFCENQKLSNLIKQVKNFIKNYQINSKEANQNLTKSLSVIKLYSNCIGFIKILSDSSIHKSISQLLNQKFNQMIQLLVLDIFHNLLINKQQYKGINQSLQMLNKPMVESLKNSKSQQKLISFLKILQIGIQNNLLNKEYIRNNNILNLLQSNLKKQQPAIQKIVNQIKTILELKQGKIKLIPLEVNRKIMNIKQLQKVIIYIDNIINLDLYDHVKKQQLEHISQFLDLHQNQFTNENQEQIQVNIFNLKNKILKIIKYLFGSKVAVGKLATPKILNALIQSLQRSILIKQTLELIQIILSICNITYNQQKTLEILHNIVNNSPINDQIISSCGQILYYLNSMTQAKQLMKNFKDSYQNIQYLKKLTTFLTTIPDEIDQEDIASTQKILSQLNNQNLEDKNQEIIKYWIILLIRISKISNHYKENIRNQKKLLLKLQNLIQKITLTTFILDFFSNIIGIDENIDINTIQDIKQIDRTNLAPIDDLLKQILCKVIQNNKYTTSQIKFIEKMIGYENQIIVEKVKLKNNQLIYQAGTLFALILENNKIESKNLPTIIQELQRQIYIDNRNLLQVLLFFASLKIEQNAPSPQNLISLLKKFSGLSSSKYELYPQNYVILNLNLKVLQKSLNKKSNENYQLQLMRNILQDLLKIFYIEPKSKKQIYNQDQIMGKQNKKQNTIENIYRCFYALSKKQSFKFKENDLLVKCAQDYTNPYIIYKMAAIIQNCNFPELNQIKSKLKFSLSRYPKVKNLIIFDKKYQKHEQKIFVIQKQHSNQDNILQDTHNQYQQQQKVQIFQQNVNPQKPLQITQKVSTETQQNKKNLESNQNKNQELVQVKITKFIPQTLSSQIIENELNNLISSGSTTKFPITKVLDCIEEKNNSIANKLLMLYTHSKNQEINKNVQIRNLILKKISQQNLQATPQLFEMFEKYPETLRLTEKIKIQGEKALNFGIKIMNSSPAFGCRIIQYNILNQTKLEISEQNSLIQIIYEVFSSKIQNQQVIQYAAQLIAVACKIKEFQIQFHQLNIYEKMIKSLKIHINNSSVILRLFYALSSVTYRFQQGAKAILNEENMKLFLQSMKKHKNSPLVIQSGCCLISNLCFHNEISKRTYLTSQVVETIIQLFMAQLENNYRSETFKQLLRLLGNCSLFIQNSRKLVEMDFVKYSIQLIESVNYNEDLIVLKYIIEVFSNLASHTDKEYEAYIPLIHKHGGLDIILTLLQTQLLNADIIACCIDFIDGMCQNKDVQRYAVSNRMIPLLIDILKSNEWDESIVVKGVRICSNLTLQKEYIKMLLELNFCSVLANIIGNGKIDHSKLSRYSMKIINRISNAKCQSDLISKSRYLDCVLQSLIKEVHCIDELLNIIITNLKGLPKDLNNKMLLIIFSVLFIHIKNQTMTGQCITIIKSIEDSCDVQQAIPSIVRLYNNMILNRKILLKTYPSFLLDLFSLLVTFCGKSQDLKAILRQKQFLDGLINFKQMIPVEEEILLQALYSCIFIILNQHTLNPVIVQNLQLDESKKYFEKGVICKIYRKDSTFKKGIINIIDNELRGVKYPNGPLKDKYRLNILNIKDRKFSYLNNTRIWQESVFSKSGGLFEKAASAKKCCTILGPVTKIGGIIFNLQFQSENETELFEKHLVNLLINVNLNKQ